MQSVKEDATCEAGLLWNVSWTAEGSWELVLASYYIQASNSDGRGFLKQKMTPFIKDLSMHLTQKSERLKEDIL